jgi:DnaK suppressor protein
MPKSSKAAPKSAVKSAPRTKAKPRAVSAASPPSAKAVPKPTIKASAPKAATKAPAPKAAIKVPAKRPPTSAGAKRQPPKAPVPGKATKKAPARKRGDDAAVDRFFEEQRAALIEERKASERQARSLRAEAEQLAEEMEPGDTQFDEESGEGGTLNVERERDLALSAQAWAAVDEVDHALGKIDAGTYGICEQCGQPIPKARLKALPYATLCVACKSGGLSRR